jgi:hypothetical protein
MDWKFIISKPAMTYMEKLIKGMVMTAVILTTCWTGLAILIPEITGTVFLGGLLVITGIAVFIGQFTAWDG